MRRDKIILRIISLAALGLALSACLTLGSLDDLTIVESEPQINETELTEALSDLGTLLSAYPFRRPYPLDEPVIVGIEPIPNNSGEEGLPPDFSTVLTTIVSTVGQPIVAKPPISYREREAAFGRDTQTGPEPDLTLRGSVTGGEKVSIIESGTDVDAVLGTGRKSIDAGGSKGRDEEVWALALDLHLVTRDGVVAEAVSYRINVERRGRTASYGVFFKGSGVGFRARRLVAQSKSQALRIAAQQCVIVLLGRYFQVPYWRIVPDAEPDQDVIDTYRRTLEDGHAPEDFRLLLFAYGLNIDLASYGFTPEELRSVADLRRRCELPAGTSDLAFAMHLWLNLPIEESRILVLRRQMLTQGNPWPSQDPTLLDAISQLRPGQELALPVYFEYSLSSLTEPTRSRIDLLVEALKNSGLYTDDWWIELRGHCDERGERLKNQQLSERRAERVRSYLEEHSIPAARMVSAGFGSTEPAVLNAVSEEEHRQNRRVEILLVAGRLPDPAAQNEISPSPTNRISQTTLLLPPEQWPLPSGISLSSQLSQATLSTIRESYPDGRFNSSFGYYSIRLSPDESELFSEITFFFKKKTRDPLVSWVELSCRTGAEEQVRSAVLQHFPQSQADGPLESVMTWTDADGYNLTIGQEPYCFKIEPAS